MFLGFAAASESDRLPRRCKRVRMNRGRLGVVLCWWALGDGSQRVQTCRAYGDDVSSGADGAVRPSRCSAMLELSSLLVHGSLHFVEGRVLAV